MNERRIVFSEVGSEHFARRLQTFLRTTDEYAHLEPYYEVQVLARLVRRRPRRLFLEIGPGTGASLTRKLAEFECRIGVEPTRDLHPQLLENNPGMMVIGKKFQEVTDDELHTAARWRLPRFAGPIQGTHDFIQFSHVFYYEPHDGCLQWLKRAARLLAPGGSMFAVLQAQESQFHEMFRHFIGQRYSLEQLAADFAADEAHRGWKIESSVLSGSVRLTTFEEALEVAAFMLCYAPANMPYEDEFRDWVEEHFRNGRGYVVQNNQRVVIFTKPEE